GGDTPSSMVARSSSSHRSSSSPATSSSCSSAVAAASAPWRSAHPGQFAAMSRSGTSAPRVRAPTMESSSATRQIRLSRRAPSLAERQAVLVLRAAGFFGLAIVRALTAHGLHVIASDRVDPDQFIVRPGTRTELVRYERRDVTSEPLDDLASAVGGAVHAAALTPQDEAAGDTADRLVRVNLESLLALLRAANASSSCRRVLFVSSAGVYDQRRAGSLTEADADGGTSLYGAAKLAGEIIGRRYASVVGLDFAAVRPTSLYGAGELVRESRPRVTAFAQLVDA